MDNVEFSYRIGEALGWDGRVMVCFSCAEDSHQWMRFRYVSTGATAERVLRDGGGGAFMAQIPELAPVTEGVFTALEEFTAGYEDAEELEDENLSAEGTFYGDVSENPPSVDSIMEGIRDKVRLHERDEVLADQLANIFLTAVGTTLTSLKEASTLPSVDDVSGCSGCGGTGIQVLPCDFCLGDIVKVPHLGLLADPNDLILDEIVEAHERELTPEELDSDSCETCQSSGLVMHACAACAGSGLRNKYVTVRFISDGSSVEVPLWLPYLYEKGFIEFGCEVISSDDYLNVRCRVEFMGLIEYLRESVLGVGESEEFYIFTDKTEMLYEYLQGFAVEFGVHVRQDGDSIRYRLDLMEEDELPIEDQDGWLTAGGVSADDDAVEELLVRGLYFVSEGLIPVFGEKDLGMSILSYFQRLITDYWAEIHYEAQTVEEQKKEAEDSGIALAERGYVIRRDGFLVSEQDSFVLLREIADMLAPFGYGVGLGYRFSAGYALVSVVSIIDETGYIYGDLAAGRYWECVLMDARRKVSVLIEDF